MFIAFKYRWKALVCILQRCSLMFFGTWIHTLKSSMPNVFTWVMTLMISKDIMIGDIKKEKNQR